MKKGGATGYFYAFLALFCWGATYVVGKYVMAAVPPMLVTGIRYAIAIALLWLLLRGRAHRKMDRADYKWMLLIAFTGYFVSMNAQFLGTKLTNASVSSLINSINPVFIMVFAALILKERLTWAKAASVAVSLAGVYCVVGGTGGAFRPLGIVCAVTAMLTWAIMSVLMRRMTQKYDPLRITLYGLALGLGMASPFVVHAAATAPPVAWSPGIVSGLLFLGLVGTVLGHICWNRALSMLEAGSCCLFYPVMPLTSVLGGVLFLHEPVGPGLVLGAALIASGVVFGTLSDKKRQMRGI
ncbi:DMT family transporter [Intestinibacillus massiliensis]|nr:DMT family transporter [Intestinibacillus massiliensis]